MKNNINAPVIFFCSGIAIAILSVYLARSEILLAGVSFVISMAILHQWGTIYIKAKLIDSRSSNKNKTSMSTIVNVSGITILIACQSAFLLWGNSISPLWGVGLEQKQEWAEIIARADNETKANSDREFDLKYTAKAAVKSTLKDPSSATFSGLSANSSSGVVCGEVNSKNSLGGMSGYQRFIYDGSVYLAETDKDIGMRWQKMCN